MVRRRTKSEMHEEFRMMNRFIMQTVIGFVWMLCSPAALIAAELPLCLPVEGAPFRAELKAAELEPVWKLQFIGAEDQHELPVADLVAWGGFVEPVSGVQIVLVGGGLIVADNVSSEDDRLHAVSPVFGKLSLPMTAVAGIIFRPPLDRARADALHARVLAPPGETDRALLDNGDELAGTVASLGGTTLSFQAEVGKLDLGVDKLAAVIFNPILLDKPQLAGLRMLVGFRDGSRVTAISLVADVGGARIKLAGGVELSAPVDAIVALQPLGGRVVYLSDLKPVSYRHIPYLELSWPYAADRSVLASRLRAEDRLYLKGLGMHSPSRITFDLDGPYRRFDAEAALDAETGPRGSVVFRVFTDDGSGQWQEKSTSDTIRGSQPPVPITVDLTGAKRISLLVDYADRGDEQDHADWLNARLVR